MYTLLKAILGQDEAPIGVYTVAVVLCICHWRFPKWKTCY